MAWSLNAVLDAIGGAWAPRAEVAVEPARPAGTRAWAASRAAPGARVRFLGIAAVLVLALPGIARAQEAGERRIERLADTDLPGFDYDILRGVSLDDCEKTCIGDGVCRGFTFNTKAGWCFLKSDIGAPASFAGAVSGRLTVRSAEAAVAPLPLPDLSFLPADVVSDAARYRAEVAAAARLGRALPPLSVAETAAAATADGAGWLALSRSLAVRSSDDWQVEAAIERAALGTAYLALAGATSGEAQADALAALSTALQKRSQWRPALDTLRASLRLVADPARQEAYDALRAEWGFRILDYSIDSDAAAPRMCVQFSEPLAVGTTDFAKYVAVAGMPSPVVTASANELCVDGLTHGERYDVTVRRGVPSTVGESLADSASYTVFVRDRRASARFAGSAYVLPRQGARGVPVITVNTEGLVVDILRVGDRALAREVVGGRFQRQLQPYEVEEIARDTGARVWTGRLAVERKLNQEVTTAFPIDEAVGRLDPGVYVLAARPQEEPEWTGTPRATQWFVVSDLGLAAFSGSDGVHAFVRSLGTAAPVAGATVRLVARNDEVLGEAATDASGHVAFAAGLARGEGGMAPAIVVAETAAGDYSFLDLTAPAFDLSDRGVEGRPAPGPLDAFVYAERGVYRAGETVHLAALLRDARARAVPDLPLTLKVTRPDGVEYARAAVPDGGLGGRALDVDLVPTAMTGTWRAEAFADPKAPPIGATTFLVEDFVPRRIALDLSTEATTIAPGTPAEIALEARYLYGAPAADLGIEGEVVVRPVAEVAAMPGFRFGLADDPAVPQRAPILALLRTGADGEATVGARLPELEPSTRPRLADVVLRVREAGGRAVEERLTLPVTGAGPAIGVKPLFADDRVGEGATAAFEVAALGDDGEPGALAGVAWELLKIDRRFQWYNRDGRWDYQVVESTSRAASGTLDLVAGRPARIEAPVQWGTYRLVLTSAAAPDAATSVDFAAGWVALGAGPETPDLLELSLDKAGYTAGETARLRLTPQFAGTALVAVVGDGLVDMRAVAVPAEGTTVDLPVGADWGPGAYVTASLYRPMDVDAGQMPARAIGLSWLAVDRAEDTLGVAIDAPAEVKPRGPLTVPVTVTGLAPGEKAFVTLAAVDVGILDLTHYQAPDADGWFLGQRRLSADIRDLYGSLIDSLTATRGAIRTGGDAGGSLIEAAPPTQELVSQFSGIVAVDAAGRAEAQFELPAFNGTVRLMAVAWSQTKVGDASRDVLVRDPVVVSGTMPRFLAPGDRSRLRLDFDNVAGAAGAYALSVTADGGATVDGVPATVDLAAGGRASAAIGLAGVSVGTATVAVALTAPDGTVFDQSFTLPVRPPAATQSLRSHAVVDANGGELQLGGDRLSGFVAHSASLSVTVSTLGGVDVPGLVTFLDRYPYGCAEQTVSRALPLLYLDEVARSVGLGSDAALAGRLRSAVERVLQLQNSSGGFGMWSPWGSDSWLTAYVADFLTRAREAGVAVPETALSLALDRLQNDLSFQSDFEAGQGSDVAYSLYVLARNGRASIADLRYFADDRLADFGSSFAKAQLGAALALYGDTGRAESAFVGAAENALAPTIDEATRTDFGTALRDTAGAFALAAESGDAGAGTLVALGNMLEQQAAATTDLSTQEAAWMVVAARAADAPASGIDLEVDGLPQTGALFRRLTAASLAADGPLTIRNRGDEALLATITAAGVPLAPPPAGENGLTLDRTLYHLDGTPAGGDRVTQNERFVVVLTVTATEPRRSRLLLADLLPAGFEIENPALVTGADLAAFPWLAPTSPAATEFRDDRFVAAWEPDADATQGLTVAYMVRAVTPGTYARPGASVEDMYRPEIFARTAAATLTVSPAAP